ncbi:PilZ domain-containing protein [Thalassotalea maritima]|uniref:PilZ domain-containing protein n=1 Tax=Thalassotalea maritima TaxID=3242416 RepID=UPI003528EDFB
MLHERRFSPRKTYITPVQLVAKDGSEWPAQSQNLSLLGMEIGVNKQTVEHLTQFKKLPIEFNLSFSNHPLEQLPCRLVINRRCAHDDFILGVKFVNLSPQQNQLIQQLIT